MTTLVIAMAIFLIVWGYIVAVTTGLDVELAIRWYLLRYRGRHRVREDPACYLKLPT